MKLPLIALLFSTSIGCESPEQSKARALHAIEASEGAILRPLGSDKITSPVTRKSAKKEQAVDVAVDCKALLRADVLSSSCKISGDVASITTPQGAVCAAEVTSQSNTVRVTLRRYDNVHLARKVTREDVTPGASIKTTIRTSPEGKYVAQGIIRALNYVAIVVSVGESDSLACSEKPLTNILWSVREELRLALGLPGDKATESAEEDPHAGHNH